MRDLYQRKIDYMRISITDLCNLRCRYCMPYGIEKISMSDILTFEEIKLVVSAAADIGISHIRITGGEPLVRKGCANLVGMIKSVPGIEDVYLTTNGVLLNKHLPKLIENGIDGVNISLDTLDRDIYKRITGVDALDEVLKGIDAALLSGLQVKVNCVLQNDLNKDHWSDLIMLAKDRPIYVRFIEMMPIGYGGDYTTVSNKWLLDNIKTKFADIAESKVAGNGPANYIHIPGFVGKIGFISAIHTKFCDSCNRIRLTSTGKIKPCLCFGDSYDIKEILRFDYDDNKKMTILKDRFTYAILGKPKEHLFDDRKAITEKHNMIDIGG